MEVTGAQTADRRPIAFFLPSVRLGGAQRVMVNLVQGISDRGYPVDLVLATAEGVFLDQLAPAVRLVDLRAGRLIRSISPLAGYLRRENPRMLVSAMSHANTIALWAARLSGRGTPVMVTEHDTMSVSTRDKGRVSRNLLRFMLRAFYPWADEIVAVSRGSADDLAREVGLPRDRIEVVYNPVITRSILAQAEKPADHPWFAAGEPPVILGVGRLTRQKDFPTLIRAFAQLRRCRSARLIILGEGPDRAELEALVRELGVGDDVSLPGFRPNPVAYMAQSALFVLSSAWEGLPTVLIEAMAVGTRVISTDCPSGPREILQEGRLGQLVPVGDPEALSAAMIRALEQPRDQLPPEVLAEFSMDAAVDNYLRLIERAS